MTGSSKPTQDRLQGLSQGKTKLLEQLLLKKAPWPQITRCARTDGARVALMPASAAQRRLWFINRLEGGSVAYHIPVCIRLRGQLDRPTLQDALDDLVARHEVLRTAFVDVDGEPVQQIAPQGRIKLRFADLSGVAHADDKLLAYSQQDLSVPFDLSSSPLLRARLLQVSESDNALLMTIHHSISDGWSIGVMIRELQVLYEARRQGRADPLPPLQLQYADYAQWQREWPAGGQLVQQLKYWTSHLQGAPQLLELPTDRPRPAVQSYQGRSVELALGAQVSADLRSLARRLNLTPAMLLYAGWTIVLSRLSAQEDVVIGMPVANRQHTEIEGLIGLFVNTVAVRVTIHDDLRLTDLLQRVREAMLEAYARQDTPFEKVVEALQPARSLSHTPLFQVMFVMHNASRAAAHSQYLTFEEQELPLHTAHFDLTLSLRESRGQIIGAINYATALFDEWTIRSWADCFVEVLCAMLSKSDQPVGALPLMSERAVQRVVEVFNGHSRQFAQDRLIHQVFEQQVERTPDAVAAVYEDASLTYAQLNARANQLARYLRDRGVGADELVALCTDRSLELVVGLMAILKAGGAYVPLDPVQPRERLAQVLDDCKPVTLLTRVGLREHVAGLHAGTSIVLDLSAWSQSAWADASTRNLEPDGSGGDCSRLAYVIYTSGSTGKPKGVMLEHRNVLHFLHGLEECIHGLQPDCRRIAWNSSFGFDMSVKAWGQLIRGRTVYLIPEAVRLSGEGLVSFLERHAIDAIECTPSHLRVMQDAGLLRGRASSLRKVLLGGEAIGPATWRTLADAENVAFFNMYGPTECSVDASCGRITGSTPHVGRVMPNVRIYILSPRGGPVPMRAPGEIYIGGAGVARGYLNRPELTAERFVRDPFSAAPQARMYRTGDLGRWRPDGTIEYLGRNDQQVKVRGFRIELGEIEAQLTRHEGVKEAVVIAAENAPDEKRLVAYVVPADPSRAPALDELGEHLRAVLPAYMVPNAFVMMERLPLNANGKLDRRALPPPDPATYAKRRYEPPQGEVEETVARIWQELLRVPRVGRQDSFFELGGHSLLAVKTLFRLSQVLGCTLSVTDMYRNPSVRELAARITGGGSGDQFVCPPREAMLDEAVKALPAPSRVPARALLLTGGTGFVGRFLLVQLLRDTSATVHCLVRDSSRSRAASRIKERLMKWDLWRDEFEERIVAVPGDLRLARLGIDAPVYDHLCRAVDAIYHCATSMNHLETYEMARPANVDAVRELLRLATTAKPKLLNYVSTLSIFSARCAADRSVDEASTIDHEQHLSSSGYAASKWVGEKIVMTAGERGIPCNIFRLGLVWADAQRGRYDELQREYRIFKSCLLSGCGIADYGYAVPPIPVDHVALAVVTLAQRRSDGGGIFHLSAAAPGIDDVFGRCNQIMGTRLRLLPFYDWIREMKRLHDSGCSLPVIPLIEYAFSMDEATFYEQLHQARSARVRVDCARTSRELESAGVPARVLDDELLKVFLADMLSRNDDLHELRHGGMNRAPSADEVAARDVGRAVFNV